MSLSRKLLKDLEDSLLKELAFSSGNMLDNPDLVDALDLIKEKAVDATSKLAQATQTRIDIDRMRDGYRPAARLGIFFTNFSDPRNYNSHIRIFS